MFKIDFEFSLWSAIEIKIIFYIFLFIQLINSFLQYENRIYFIACTNSTRSLGLIKLDEIKLIDNE